VKRKVYFVAAAILSAAIVFWVLNRPKKSELSFTEINPTRGSLRITVTSTGSVSPEGRIEMKPPVPGRMESVRVKEGQRVARGQIIAWMSSTERAALLDSARAVSAEEYKKFQEYYKATPIVAPTSGTIILRNAEPGQTVSAADVLLVVADRLQVVAKVDETDIARVNVGAQAEIILDAYPKEPIGARVSSIAFEAKTVNNVTSYDVKTLPNKQPDFMRSGMTANVTFILKEKANVLLVPVAAIQFKKESPFVLARDSKGTSLEMPVELGDSDGAQTEILSGVDEKTVVLVQKLNMPTKQGTNPFMPARGGRGSGGKSRAH